MCFRVARSCSTRYSQMRDICLDCLSVRYVHPSRHSPADLMCRAFIFSRFQASTDTHSLSYSTHPHPHTQRIGGVVFYTEPATTHAEEQGEERKKSCAKVTTSRRSLFSRHAGSTCLQYVIERAQQRQSRQRDDNHHRQATVSKYTHHKVQSTVIPCDTILSFLFQDCHEHLHC